MKCAMQFQENKTRVVSTMSREGRKATARVPTLPHIHSRLYHERSGSDRRRHGRGGGVGMRGLSLVGFFGKGGERAHTHSPKREKECGD